MKYIYRELRGQWIQWVKNVSFFFKNTNKASVDILIAYIADKKKKLAQKCDDGTVIILPV